MDLCVPVYQYESYVFAYAIYFLLCWKERKKITQKSNGSVCISRTIRNKISKFTNNFSSIIPMLSVSCHAVIKLRKRKHFSVFLDNGLVVSCFYGKWSLVLSCIRKVRLMWQHLNLKRLPKMHTYHAVNDSFDLHLVGCVNMSCFEWCDPNFIAQNWQHLLRTTTISHLFFSLYLENVLSWWTTEECQNGDCFSKTVTFLFSSTLSLTLTIRLTHSFIRSLTDCWIFITNT